MPRASTTRIVLSAALLIGAEANLSAQTVQSPLVPRGSFFLRITPSATTVKGRYGPLRNGELPLGQSFSLPSIGTAEVPSLGPTAERFGALAGASSTPSIRLGATSARFSADERVLPIRVTYGVLDRLTLGVTIPIIRKRLETLLRLTPEGADVGQSPFQTDGAMVSTFLGDADASLDAVQTSVEDRCLQLGEQAAECIEGRALVSDADSFLTELGGVYGEEDLFPLMGSQLGDGISTRWTNLVTAFADWGTAGPEDLPLAASGVDQATFESLVVAPAWPVGGFPLETPDAGLGLGDVEVNIALGLLRPDPPPAIGIQEPGLQVHVSAVGTVRFATGSADSLRTVAPMDPPRGVSGFSLGAVTDVLFSGRLRRFALLGNIEAGWNGTREMTLLAPDPARAFIPGEAKADVRWTPGAYVRASVTPRFRFGPGLSLGMGWRFSRREPDEFEAVATGGGTAGPSLFPTSESFTQQRLALEIRYVAMEEPLLSGVPFPFEILFRGSRSVAGSEGAAVEKKAEAMIRFRIRD